MEELALTAAGAVDRLVPGYDHSKNELSHSSGDHAVPSHPYNTRSESAGHQSDWTDNRL